MAKSVRQRHRLVVDVLLAVGAPREAAEADAEGIEHYVSGATLRAFEAFLARRRPTLAEGSGATLSRRCRLRDILGHQEIGE